MHRTFALFAIGLFAAMLIVLVAARLCSSPENVRGMRFNPEVLGMPTREEIEASFAHHRSPPMSAWREIGVLHFPPGRGGEERVLKLLERRSSQGRQWEYAAQNRDGVLVPIKPQGTNVSRSHFGLFRWNASIDRMEGTLEILGYGTMNFSRTV